jgi:hypothetical protein
VQHMRMRKMRREPARPWIFTAPCKQGDTERLVATPSSDASANLSTYLDSPLGHMSR